MIQTTDPLLLLLHNWSRWCNRTGDCKPVGYQNGAPFENMAKPYKTLTSEDDALDEMDRRREPHEPSAVRIEGWVVQLPDLPRAAIRVYWVDKPEWMRHITDRTFDQWQEERVWTMRKRLKATGAERWNVRREDLEREAGEGMHILRDCLTTWTAGV